MANALEAQLRYPWGDTLPETGHAMEVAPGVRWLRMPLPFALDHINLWLLRDEAEDGSPGWAVVDCGLDIPEAREAWTRLFAHGLDGLPILRVIVTHMHPDHLGLAHWLCAQWGCRMWISATDFYSAGQACRSDPELMRAQAEKLFSRHGLTDPQRLAAVRAHATGYAHLVPQLPDEYRRLLHGLTLRIGPNDWHCIVGHGHAPEHIALHCPALNLLISGDMLLPRISTNISVYGHEPEANPLPLFLQSIERFRPLPADTLVLPSHGKPFTGAHQRIDQLQAHHALQFDLLVAACAEAPRSAAELLPVLFKRTLDVHQTSFAMGEAIAHLHALQEAGRLRALPSDEDGVLRYVPVLPAAPAMPSPAGAEVLLASR
ncbi:MBL fold metallo-hydrolase [Ideonella azotifigens]|uniref:MBL fold metallo-hydrolase n=1 Tax=Ideonella azotifigens TaxID=513160 RepID=A0ABN1KDY3_9BURK|nr:MBL fold metallo-hydrolase [Ideonella azotifigens]MCD2344562.1 MBL fold metallo-hydrolase [Ideonella azotifigens]